MTTDRWEVQGLKRVLVARCLGRMKGEGYKEAIERFCEDLERTKSLGCGYGEAVQSVASEELLSDLAWKEERRRQRRAREATP